jgi:Flp pilus assembly protein protease CpaA
MLLEIVLPIIATMALLIASYTDLKTREVPDWVSYGLIFTALGIRLIFSIQLGYEIILSGVIGLLICIVLGYMFYYSRQWGGGDSKLLMGMGAVIGIPYPFTVASWDIAIFLISLLFLGAIWGILWMGYIAIKNWSKFRKAFIVKLRQSRTLHLVLWVLTIFLGALSFVDLLFLPFIMFPIPFFYLFIFMTSVEKTSFISTISVTKLVEGDWLAKDVVRDGKILLHKTTIEKKDINKLKAHHVSSVVVKQGVPFVPGFLFGYLFLLFGTEIIMWLLQLVF